MVEKTNKSTTILLLVIAGVLLFLVGSFTGQIWKIPKLPKTPTPTTETGLTTEQKQDVLNILNKCQWIPQEGPAETGDMICSHNGLICISSERHESSISAAFPIISQPCSVYASRAICCKA